MLPNNELKDNRYVGRRAVIFFYCKNTSKKFEKDCKNLLTNSQMCVIIRHNKMKGSNKMKTFMVRYTDDCGATHHTKLVSANTFTEAYVKVYSEISQESAITDLFEII